MPNQMTTTTRRNIKSEDWFGLRRNTGKSCASDFSDYEYDALHLPIAGLRSDRVNHDPRHAVYESKPRREGKKQVRDFKSPGHHLQGDLSMLKMAEDTRAPEKEKLGFHSRIDPSTVGEYLGYAGHTSDGFTYTIGAHENNWEFKDRPTSKARSKSERKRKEQDRTTDPHGVFIKHLPRGYGEANPGVHTDPITHFKHEGIVFKDPHFSSKKCDYDVRATRQNFHLDPKQRPPMDTSTQNDQAHIEMRQNRYKKDLLDALGKMHYYQGGEEDMCPAATKPYMKCEKKPTDRHVKMNDKAFLAWCERPDKTPRHNGGNQSNQIWDVLHHDGYRSQEGDTAPTVTMGTQCEIEDSEIRYLPPPELPKRVLKRSRSAPSSDSAAGERVRVDDGERDSIPSIISESEVSQYLGGLPSAPESDVPSDPWSSQVDTHRTHRRGSSAPTRRVQTAREFNRAVRDAAMTTRSLTPPPQQRSLTPPRRESQSIPPRTLITPESSTLPRRQSVSEVSEASSRTSFALQAALKSAAATKAWERKRDEQTFKYRDFLHGKAGTTTFKV